MVADLQKPWHKYPVDKIRSQVKRKNKVKVSKLYSFFQESSKKLIFFREKYTLIGFIFTF